MPRIADNLTHLAGRPFALAAAFAADGIVPNRWDDTGTYYEDRRFLYRLGGHCHRPTVQVAVRAHFDRWANSVDFQFSAPSTLRAYRKRMRRLDRAYAAGRYASGWGQEVWV